MAPQQKSVSLCFATMAVLAICSQAADITITATIPFNGNVPSVSTIPGLAGFKDRFKQAWSASLNYIGGVTGSGAAPAPALSTPSWQFTQTVATATFTYSDAYLSAILYLVASPSTFYYYSNDTSSAGYKLINVYRTNVEDTTFDIGPKSPPSPPPPGPAPPLPVGSNLTLGIASTLVSRSIPDPSDTVAFAAFQNAYYLSFAKTMNCAAAGNATSADACANVSANATGGFPTQPKSANWTVTLVPDPNYKPGTKRRALLVDAPAGQIWQIVIRIIYEAIPATLVQTYETQQSVIVSTQTSVLVQVVKAIGQVLGEVIQAQSSYVSIPGTNITISSPPGYGSDSSTTGRRRMIERSLLRPATSTPSTINWATTEPSDVAYGTDKSLYEIFSTPANYFQAGAACAARGAKLASYSTEGAQIFIDILCDAVSGGQCWVEGNANDACSSVGFSSLHKLACTTEMPFVCAKVKSATETKVVSSNSANTAVLAASKPTDVAFDVKKNLYELFAMPVDYFTAGAVCVARGGELASYNDDAAQVIIDVLCESDASHTCWVAGNQAGKCTSLKTSDVHQVACTKKHAFVCSKRATR